MTDLFPLFNSIRISLLSSAVVFALGVAAASFASARGRAARAFLDVLFTVPLVLPPTVIGYLLLMFMAPARPMGEFFLRAFGVRLVMKWYSAVFAVSVVSFPLMYRAVRAAFDSYDMTLTEAGRTLGLSEPFIFFRIKLPACRSGLLAGAVLSFARGLGEYGATGMVSGYTPGKTSTIATEVYSLWAAGDDARAFTWVCLNLAISVVVLTALNFIGGKGARASGKANGAGIGGCR